MRLVKIYDDVWKYGEIEGSFEFVMRMILKKLIK